MKRLTVQIVLVSSMLSASCLKQQRAEPPHPGNVSGWEVQRREDGRMSMSFVLKKGETSSNGKIQIKIVDIIPGDFYAGAGNFNRQARAKIKFIRVSDGKTLCEDTYAEKSGAILNANACGVTPTEISVLGSYGVSTIVVSAINLQEGWVFFQVNS